MELSFNAVTLLYLVASICFIQALKGLSHPTTSRLGNTFGMVGMAIAIATTIGLIFKLAEIAGQSAVTGLGWVLAGLVVGGGLGTVMAKRVEMTKMPELVAFMQHDWFGCCGHCDRCCSRARRIWYHRQGQFRHSTG